MAARPAGARPAHQPAAAGAGDRRHNRAGHRTARCCWYPAPRAGQLGGPRPYDHFLATWARFSRNRDFRPRHGDSSRTAAGFPGQPARTARADRRGHPRRDHHRLPAHRTPW